MCHISTGVTEANCDLNIQEKETPIIITNALKEIKKD